MPTHHQLTVQTPATTKDLGKSDTKSLQTAFPASPIHDGELTDQVVHDQGQSLLVDGIVNDGGHTYGVFNRDYPDAPELQDVKTGGGGLPGTPYAPNIASPGPGSANPTDIPAVGVEATNNAKGTGAPFVGDGSASPAKTTRVVSKQKIGSLVLGSSETK